MTSSRVRRWGLRASVPALVALVLLCLAPPAWSHSELDRSDPPNGGMVAPGRTSLRLWFGEPVSPSASRFFLEAANGRRVDVRSTIDGDGGAVRLETAAPMAVGTYELQWRAFSLEDGHTSTGTVLFGVGLRPPVVPDAGSALPPAGLVILRGVDLASLLAAVGALAVSGRVLGGLGDLGGGARRRARRIAMVATCLAAYAGLMTPFVRTWGDGLPDGASIRESWDLLLHTAWGHLWLARVLATVAAAVLVWWWARRGAHQQALQRSALAALTAASMLGSFAGHASTLPRLSGPAAVLGAAHVLAAGVWAGGVGVLVVCLLPLMRRQPELRGVVLSSTWRRFSPMAAVSTVVLLATGLYEAGRHVPRLAAVTDTVYGGAVAAKTVLLAVGLAMGGLNLLVVSPAARGRAARLLGRPESWTPVSHVRFPRLVTIEALVLAAAVGLAAILTTSPTAREAEDAARVTAPRTATAEGLYVTLENVTTGPGHNLLVARTRPTVLPPPAPVVGVDVELARGRHPQTVRLVRTDEGRFEGTATTSEPGNVPAVLHIHRLGLPDVIVDCSVTVTPTPGSRVTQLEVVGTVSGLGLLIGLLAAVVVIRRRHRDEDAPDPVSTPEPEREMSLP